MEAKILEWILLLTSSWKNCVQFTSSDQIFRKLWTSYVKYCIWIAYSEYRNANTFGYSYKHCKQEHKHTQSSTIKTSLTLNWILCKIIYPIYTNIYIYTCIYDYRHCHYRYCYYYTNILRTAYCIPAYFIHTYVSYRCAYDNSYDYNYSYGYGITSTYLIF